MIAREVSEGVSDKRKKEGGIKIDRINVVHMTERRTRKIELSFVGGSSGSRIGLREGTDVGKFIGSHKGRGRVTRRAGYTWLSSDPRHRSPQRTSGSVVVVVDDSDEIRVAVGLISRCNGISMRGATWVCWPKPGTREL